MRVHTCVSLSKEQYDFCKKNLIKMSKLLQEAIDDLRPMVEKEYTPKGHTITIITEDDG